MNLDYGTVQFILDTMKPPLETEETLYLKYRALYRGKLSKEEFVAVLEELERMGAIERRQRPDGVYLIKKMGFREWLEEHGKEKKVEIEEIPADVKPLASYIADACITLIQEGKTPESVKSALDEIKRFVDQNAFDSIPETNPLKRAAEAVINRYGEDIIKKVLPYVYKMVPQFQ